jgi:transposase InsO family protein
MTDNALAYRRGRAWHQALADLGAQARFTRRYRPQTNGQRPRRSSVHQLDRRCHRYLELGGNSDSSYHRSNRSPRHRRH